KVRTVGKLWDREGARSECWVRPANSVSKAVLKRASAAILSAQGRRGNFVKWSRIPWERRSEMARELVNKRWAAVPAARRRQIARALARKRWPKKTKKMRTSRDVLDK